MSRTFGQLGSTPTPDEPGQRPVGDAAREPAEERAGGGSRPWRVTKLPEPVLELQERSRASHAERVGQRQAESAFRSK